jgi:uncharacterized membrane protein YcfT
MLMPKGAKVRWGVIGVGLCVVIVLYAIMAEIMEVVLVFIGLEYWGITATVIASLVLLALSILLTQQILRRLGIRVIDRSPESKSEQN